VGNLKEFRKWVVQLLIAASSFLFPSTSQFCCCFRPRGLAVFLPKKNWCQHDRQEILPTQHLFLTTLSWFGNKADFSTEFFQDSVHRMTNPAPEGAGTGRSGGARQAIRRCDTASVASSIAAWYSGT
jgi:hypothetical protein